MFQLFKRKKENFKELYAVADGKSIAIEQVNDPVFAGKSLGDGIAVIPEGDTIVAPCDGEISLFTSTLHAFGMVNEDGLELMIHAGIDTVALEGEGFTKLEDQGAKVKKGQPILKFDSDFMKEKGIDMTTMLILLNGESVTIHSKNVDQTVKKGMDVVITYQ